jgi:exosortase J
MAHNKSVDTASAIPNTQNKTVLIVPLLYAALAVFGSVSLAPVWIDVAQMWLSDPLRVIGAAFPFISLAGVIAVWRRLGWSDDGSFWGLLPIALAIGLSRLVNVTPYYKFWQPMYWFEVHPGPTLFLYGAGAVLLFGGWNLLRGALLPLCLLFCVNPVPKFFNSYLDMPLQQFSASTARAFAHGIGLYPTGAQLKMMFSPNFGMMIVPGCNGIRGSITLAYLALIYGYTRRLRPARLAMVSIGSLFAGYLFNLLRLCVLVIYYRIGLSVPSIQDYGAGVDYAIGCTIFLMATVGLGFLIRALAPVGGAQIEQTVVSSKGSHSRGLALLHVVGLLALTIVPISRAKGMLTAALAQPESAPRLLQVLPETVGPYKLVRTYSEQQYGIAGESMPSILLGDYAELTETTGTVHRMTLGLYLMGYHRVIDSKSIQGVSAESSGSFDAKLASGALVPLGLSVYHEGPSRQFNAETICDPSRCIDPTRYRASDYLEDSSAKHLPVLLRREWPDSEPTPTAALQSSFEMDARVFVRGLDIPSLVARLGKPLG